MKKLKYAAAFSITTLIFLIGLIIGQLIAETRLKEFTLFSRSLRTSLLSISTQEELATEYLCKTDVFKLTEEKAKLGRNLAILEKKLGKKDPIVLELKKEYSLLSIRQWLLVKKFKEECNKNLIIILFFYSNERNASLSEAQGYVLDFLYQKYPEKIVIYAFDVDLDLKIIDLLEEIFEIKQVPSLVINGKTYYGLKTRSEIEKIIF